MFVVVTIFIPKAIHLCYVYIFCIITYVRHSVLNPTMTVYICLFFLVASGDDALVCV